MEAKLLSISTSIRPRIRVYGDNEAISAIYEIMTQFTIRGLADYTLGDISDALSARGYNVVFMDSDISIVKR